MSKLIIRSVVVIAIVVMGFMAVGYLQAADKPKEVNIAIIAISVMEEPWNTALIQSLERVKKEKPDGLDIKWDVVAENVFPPDAERVLNGIAKTDKYDIIWAHSTYADAVEKLAPKYPEIMWVFAGSGNKGLGGNAYWVDSFVHESAYLLGIISGMMTKTNTIGAVAAFPYPNVNSPVNSYLEGARSVNKAIKIKMTYIDSWFDPPKAKESTLAQIAAGADFIYAERFGPFEACKEKGKYAFGHFVDQNSLAPDVVVSSTIALWDGCIKYVINDWYNHATKGTPYNAPMERIFYLMADGGADIASYHSLGDKIPQSVKDEVDKAHQAIKDGKLSVTMNEAKVSSQ